MRRCCRSPSGSCAILDDTAKSNSARPRRSGAIAPLLSATLLSACGTVTLGSAEFASTAPTEEIQSANDSSATANARSTEAAKAVEAAKAAMPAQTAGNQLTRIDNPAAVTGMVRHFGYLDVTRVQKDGSQEFDARFATFDTPTPAKHPAAPAPSRFAMNLTFPVIPTSSSVPARPFRSCTTAAATST